MAVDIAGGVWYRAGMARLARAVAPGHSHFITQRGNRRQRTFFGDSDYRAYLELMAEWCDRYGNEVWAYCLLPDHVHLVVVPSSEKGLARGIGEAHRRYTSRVNLRRRWRGCLWQGRFSSFVMDTPHLLAAVRHVETNPVRSKLCRKPWRYPWSSAAAHVAGADDALVTTAPMLKLAGRSAPDWKAYLALATPKETTALLRKHRAAFVAVSHPRLPDTVIPSTDFLYVRFHGRGESLYDYDYSNRELRRWASRLRPHLRGRTLYAFFNNDWHARAPKNAKALAAILARE